MLVGIVLEEVGLPCGPITLHRWWKTEHAAFYEQMNFERVTDDGLSDGIVERDPLEFDRVFRWVHDADRVKLNSFSSTFRDGVFYSLAWGAREQMRTIAIDNPTVGSPHDQILKNIKNCKWR